MSYETLTYSAQTFSRMNNALGYTVYVRSSEDNFGADIDSATIINSGTGTFSLDLSSLAGPTGATTFRIYAVDNSSAGGNAWFDLTGSDTATNVGLIVTGESALIPEPSSALLIGLSAFAFCGRRRRKNSLS